MPSDTERTLTYVVLDPTLQQAAPERFAALFDAFAAGYARHFSGDQMEPTSPWRARIAGKPQPQPVMRIVVGVEHVDGTEQVVAGVAAEYYRAAECVLATYLYVADAVPYRHRGHARALLREVRDACSALGQVRAMLVEAEWPESVQEVGGSPVAVATARARLRFFARLGARVLNINYVQPSLAAGKDAVSCLRLFLLPPAVDAPRLPDDDLTAIVRAFLTEFYAALAADTGGAADEATLRDLHAQLGARRPLTSPLPRLRMEDVAVCFHFVEPLDDVTNDRLLSEVRAFQCPVFHSMETDLLSRAYRTRRLFRSVCLTKPTAPATDGGIAVELELPRRVQFRSENRLEERQWPLRRRTLRAYLAPSFFFDARVVVWNLTLRTPARSPDGRGGDWLDEQDLITVLRLADDEADQEFVRVPVDGTAPERRITESLEFRSVDGKETTLDLIGLLHTVAAVAQRRLPEAPIPRKPSAPTAVTVELLDWDIRGDQPFFGVTDRLEREALCGIISGIFDFDRIDDAEALDTLTPSVALEDAVLRVHRQTLIYVRRDDRAARTVAGTLGISPYLIIPHAAVICDEWLLRPFESRTFRGGKPESVGVLSGTLQRLEDALRTKWVPNAFYYSTEHALYERALVEGGTTARRAKAEELLLELKTRLQVAREAERARFEAIVAGLLGAISVLAVDAVMIEITPWLLSLAGGSAIDIKLAGHALTFALACAAGLAIYAWKRPTDGEGISGRSESS